MSGHVRITALTHAYADVRVLDAVHLEAASGEVVALVGPTGCGKSTVLRVAAGLLRPTSGQVTIDDRSAIGVPGLTAYMPQGDSLLPWRRALDNALLGAEIRGLDLAEARGRARSLFARFGLGGFEDAWPSELSGGMRQRVALLRTVLVDAGVLLLDEPFGALDAITRTDLQSWLVDLLTVTSATTLIVTHDIDEALRLADRLVVMSPRPGHVTASLDLPAPRGRRLQRILEPDFAMMKRQVLEALGATAGDSL